MWETLVKPPRGRVSLRNFMLFFATVLVAYFVQSVMLGTPVYAAADASWEGDDIVYQSDTYTGPIDRANLRGLNGIPEGASVYQFIESVSDYQIAHIIFFQAGSTPKSDKEAVYTTYTFNPPGTYSKPSGKSTISIEPVSTGELDTPNTSSSCAVDGVGWIVCTVSNWIADGMDLIYSLVAGFLSVTPLTNSNTSLYAAWGFMRTIANLLFILAFLVIIYYYLIGTVDSKYALRTIIPRIVLVAVLVNVSYWITAVGVDLSNILGYSVQSLFNNLRDGIGAANSAAAADVGWKTVTAFVLGGGAAGYAGIAALGGSTAFSATSMSFLLIGAAIPALFALFVAFIILAARQALITLFIIISPIAFVAFLLPNTEEWFTRWRKLFMSMLLMFPAFSAIFGAAQLAGIIIIQNAPASLLGIAMVILGLVVQTVPLFITPFLIRLSSGLMGTIAGMANDKSKGIFDRTKNWADDRRDYHKVRSMRNTTPNSSLRRRAGAHYGMKQHHRERMKAAYTAQAEANYERSARGQRAYREGRIGDDQKEAAKNFNEELFQRRVRGDVDPAHRNGLESRSALLAARQDRRYAEHQQMLHESHGAGVRASIIKDAIHEEGERHVREQLNAAAPGTYENRVRGMQVQTAVDKGIAEMNKKIVDAEGQMEFRNTVLGDRALREMHTQTYELEKRASTAEAIVQKGAEAHWDYVSRTDPGTQQLRLQEVQATERAKLVEAEWNEMVENVRTKGAAAPYVAAQSAAIANSIMGTTEDIELTEKAIGEAKIVRSEEFVEALSKSANMRKRAGGIGGSRAQTRLYAKAKEDVVNAAVAEVKTNRSLTSEMTRRQLHKLMQEAEMPDGSKATTEMQQAAMYALLQDKGNNEDAQEIRDVVSRMGMMVDDRGRYYEPQRDPATGFLIRDPVTGFPQIDRTKEITDQKEISRRRDWQQFFDDAVSGSAHSLVTYSGTNKSEARAGTMVDTIREGFVRDATTGKFSPDKLLKADIDELKMLLEDLHSPSGYYATLGDAQKDQVKSTLESAILRLQRNENINAGIDDRNRGAMNDILALINPTEYGPVPGPGGARMYTVNENKAIIPQSQVDAGTATKQFKAPVDVPGVHKPGQYYKDWDVDLQL